MSDQEKTGLGNYFVANYPPFSAWNAGSLPDAYAALNAPPRANTPLGLYLHIPFCRKRCKFCYFRVYTDKNARDVHVDIDIAGVLVGVDAEVTKLASLAAKRNMQVQPERRVGPRRRVQGGIGIRQAPRIPRGERRIIGDEVIAESGFLLIAHAGAWEKCAAAGAIPSSYRRIPGGQ